jgi:hypothetical protein
VDQKAMVEEEIITLLREGSLTSTEIMEKVIRKGIDVTAEDIRQVLADMVREGKVNKKVDYGKKKFIFYLNVES